MADNKNLEINAAQHELDENENPPSLNISASISTVHDSLNLINSESEKNYAGQESANLPDDALLSVGHSTSKKNALIDSGFHCENLEKIVPDLVNNSLCEPVYTELDNSPLEVKQISTYSDLTLHSNHDNSFNTCNDVSFNTSANTSNNIALLFERLTLNSEGNSSPIEPSALPDNPLSFSTSKNEPTEVSLDKNFKQTNLLNTSFKSVESKVGSLDNSALLVKNVHPSPMPYLNTESNIENQVPLVETFNAERPVNMPINANVESLDSNATTIKDSDITISDTSDDIFKHPMPVPESCDVPNLQTAIEDNVFAIETDDNQDGEEFQDAVQFFNPSSFQALESVETSHVSGTNMPRDSLYMTFDPLYKRVIQPTNVVSVEVKENVFDEESIREDKCDVDSAKSKHVRESLGIKLVSFDSPVTNNSEKVNDLNMLSVEKEISSPENINDVDLVNEHANVIISSESLASKLEFNSPVKNFDKNSEENNDLSKESMKEEISNVQNTPMLEHKIFPQESSTNLLYCSPMKNNSEIDVLGEISIKKENFSPDNIQSDQHLISKNTSAGQEDSLMKSNLDESTEKNHDDVNKEEVLQTNQKLVKNVLARESLSGNLLSFDSPIKGNSENVAALSIKSEQRLYSEEELQQALKIYELTMQEAYLKKQKELEEDASKHGSETEKKLQRITKLCTVLLETVTELASVASGQNAKIGELSSRVKNLESENQELQSNYKTTSEDLQSVEHTFSDFHKRYVQCKDMLKTYKDNEDQLKTHSENLSKKLEEQEQMYAMLQVKMGEMIDKANAEVATAKKGGDAQLAVLKAQLKKSELKVSSLENDLKQTRIENDKLSSICDDLMAKVSEA